MLTIAKSLAPAIGLRVLRVKFSLMSFTVLVHIAERFFELNNSMEKIE
jgi:hypothetical protein